MNDDGNVDAFEKVLEDANFMREMLTKYKKPNSQHGNQLRL